MRAMSEGQRAAIDARVAQFEAAVDKQRAAIENRIRRIREARLKTGKKSLSGSEMDAIGIEPAERPRKGRGAP